EDGIRDFHVTGVQTCALPISVSTSAALLADQRRSLLSLVSTHSATLPLGSSMMPAAVRTPEMEPVFCNTRTSGGKCREIRLSSRSEERRVGKEGRPRRMPIRY